MNRIRILILNGRHLPAGEIKELHLKEDIQVCETQDPIIAMSLMHEYNIDIALIDSSSLSNKSIPYIKSIRSSYPGTDLIVIAPESFNGTFGRAVIHLLPSDLNREDMLTALQMTHSFKKFMSHQQQLDINFRKFTREIETRGGHKIIGVSKAVKSIASLILLVSQSEETSVMVTGESGTGKELVARGIHSLSQNHHNTFHAVNCSAIPESLFESEFFGYRKGAFTGAIEKSEGWFEMANNSTLFLDEITELPLCMQSKFLRVLDDKTIHRIGSHQEVKLNLRVISASNQDLDKLMSRKTFREDLYHRLNSFHIHIPPLRERPEDIQVLLEYYVGKFSERMGKPVKQIDDQAMHTLLSYPFPGNVRELKNVVEGAVILSDERKLMAKHFRICHENTRRSDFFIPNRLVSLVEMEKNAILVALRQSKNNKSEAARLLSISRQSLDRRIMKLHIV